jgi:hypothetical protein
MTPRACRIGRRTWDSNIPDWPVLKAQAAAAQAVLERHAHRLILGKTHAAQ